MLLRGLKAPLRNAYDMILIENQLHIVVGEPNSLYRPWQGLTLAVSLLFG
jgi:hypothetical protein